MKGTIRAAVLAAALLAALAFAGSAFASFAPKLVVKTVAAGVSVSVNVANADDPTAKVSIYVPAGYTLNPPALGTKLGDVTATASAADLGGAVLPLTGELDAIAQSSLTAQQVAQEQQCLAGAMPQAIWDLHLTAAGQTLDIPMYILQTTGVETTAGMAKLVVCLPPPDVPPGTPGRATFGAKLLSASFTTNGLTAPASSGDYRWKSLWTPYNPGMGTPHASASVEAQSVVHVPTHAILTVTKKRLVSYKKIHGKRVKVVKTQVKWAASAQANGQTVTNATVTTTKNGAQIGGATGSFILGKGSVTLATTVAIPDQDLAAAGCRPTPIFGGLPCIDATVGGATVTASQKVTAYTK